MALSRSNAADVLRCGPCLGCTLPRRSPLFISCPKSSSPSSSSSAAGTRLLRVQISGQEQQHSGRPGAAKRETSGTCELCSQQSREEGEAESSWSEKGVRLASPLSLLCALVVPPALGVTAGAASIMEAPVLLHDLLAAVATTSGALALLKFFDHLARHDVLDKKLSRKLVHVSVGLVFMLFWPLFSLSRASPLLAALAPAGNAVRMLLLGLGIWKDEALVKAMSREGDRRELLKGPLYYALAISIVTAVWWRTSPVGIVALVNLCAGDGFADIVGRRLGSASTSKLPYNPSKSYAGSVAMFAISFLVSILYLRLFASFGYFALTWQLVWGVCFVTLASTFVESLPISTRLDDNLTVPLTSILAGMLVF